MRADPRLFMASIYVAEGSNISCLFRQLIDDFVPPLRNTPLS